VRVRWPWGRTEPSTPASGAARRSSPPVQRAPISEWRDLAPPSGLSGPPEMTADHGFGRELSGHRALPPVVGTVARGGDLAPMMREPGASPRSTASGPAAGYGRSVDMSLQRPATPHPPAQLEAESSLESAATTSDPDASPLPAPSVPNRATAQPAATRVPQASEAPKQRSLMTVVPAAQRSAIRAGAAPAGQFRLNDAIETAVTPADSMNAFEAPSAGEAPARAAAPPESASTPSTPTLTQRAPLTSARRTVHSNPTSTRRLGLGAPLAGRPSSDRGVAASASSTTAPGLTQSVLVNHGLPPATDPARDAGAFAPPPDAGTSPTLNSRGSRLELTATPPPLPSAGPSPAPRSAAPTQRSTRTSVAPIHQRAPSSRTSTQASAPTTPPATAAGNTIRIDRSSDGASSAADLDANAYTSGDTIVMPSSHGPLDRGRGQALLAHELVHVGQQRRMGANLPAEHTGAGQQLEREAQSAESLVAEVSARAPSTEMPVAHAGVRRAPADSPSSHSSEVRRATHMALAAGPRAGHGSDAIEIPAASAGDRTPAPQRAAASASTAGSSSLGAPSADTGAGAANPQGDEEFEELARRLYERLRLRLKRELLLDRERGGFLADSR